MTELTYVVPVTGEGVSVAEPLVDTALTEIKTVVNSKIGGVNVEASLTGLRMVDRVAAFLSQNEVAGTYFFKTGANALAKATASVVKSTLTVPDLAIYNPADFAITGKTTKMTMVVTLVTNAVAPTGNYTFALYPVETAKGAENELEVKYGAAVGPEVKFEAPGAEAAANAKTTATFPASNYYSIGVLTTKETATKSLTVVTVALYAKNE